MSEPQLTPEQQQELEKLKNMSPEEIAELQKQQCIFCKLIKGEIPSKKIYEDEQCIVILDINPATKGHLLLIPKEHYAIMPQVPDQELSYLFVVAKSLSQLLLKALKVSGTNLYIANGPAAGQRSPHFMIHLIPRVEGDGIMEFEEKIIDQEMQKKIIEAVKGKLNLLLGVKEEVQETLPVEKEEEKKEKKKERYITSETAKRYHKKKCAFAQNISDERRVILEEDEAHLSEKKPCTCVTGRKIPLKKDENKPKKKTKAKKGETSKKSKKKTQKKSKKKTSKKEKKVEKKEEASLDDIANLFQ